MRRPAAILVAATIALSLECYPAIAATKIKLLYTAGDSFVESYVAADQGFFAARGLELELAAAQNGPVISAALEADSAQIGAPTPTVLLQADEQGLDLVIVASANFNPAPLPVLQEGLAAGADSGIKEPADLIGRKVALPSLGGTIDVLVKKWLQARGVDHHKIQWVEIQFPNMPGALRVGLVDAVAAVNPFYARILASKDGYGIGDFGAVTPPGTAVVVYAATRAWATANAAAVNAFRAALDDAKTFIENPANATAVRASIAKYTKLPPEAAAAIQIPVNLDPRATPQGMVFWIDASRELGLIKGNPDPASLLAP